MSEYEMAEESNLFFLYTHVTFTNTHIAHAPTDVMLSYAHARANKHTCHTSTRHGTYTRIEAAVPDKSPAPI